MATTEELAKDKRVKNFKKKILKNYPHFVEVPTREESNVILAIDEDDLKKTPFIS